MQNAVSLSDGIQEDALAVMPDPSVEGTLKRLSLWCTSLSNVRRQKNLLPNSVPSGMTDRPRGQPMRRRAISKCFTSTTTNPVLANLLLEPWLEESRQLLACFRAARAVTPNPSFEARPHIKTLAPRGGAGYHQPCRARVPLLAPRRFKRQAAQTSIAA